MKTEEEVKVIKSIREKLKECKPEWLEKNQKGQDSLGVTTVTQILDYATDAIVDWDFKITEQWREEVNRYDKKMNQWVFDGYVYHVRGYLEIEGLGKREQYGSKPAVGGKDNQNSAYKSAASDCLKKCASLFGVGSSIYSRIKIETDDTYEQHQQQQQYQQQQATQQQVALPNGDIRQGEWVWSNQIGNWIHQSQYQPEQGGQYPQAGLTAEQQQAQWYHDTMQQNDPIGYVQMREVAGPSPMELAQMTDEQRMAYELEKTVNEVNAEMAAGRLESPFADEAPFSEEPPKPENFEAVPQQEAVPQPAAQQQSFEATPQEQVDPLAHVVAQNPWNTAENQTEMQSFMVHKARLFLDSDEKLLPHVRAFFKDENATIAHVTPDVLKGFNTYLEDIQV